MKQVFTITTELEPQLDSSLLSLRIGDRHLGFSLTDFGSGSLQALTWLTGENITSAILEELYRQYPELGRAYHRVKICYDHPKSLLIPIAIYQEQDSRQLLQTVHGVTEYDLVFTDRIASWQINNSYAVPKDVHKWVSGNFANADYFHQHSVTVRNLTATEEEGHLLIDFRPDDFSLIVCRNNELMLAQSFVYSSPSDVVYYLLKCCRQFSLPADSTRLSVSGLIDQQSILYRELHQYFLGIEFKLPAWNLSGEQIYPSHFFTSLNELAKCES